tara:strand:+ start:729 stop:1088 length:360 start_codon:yes stop_codon:yes gene_type:complete
MTEKRENSPLIITPLKCTKKRDRIEKKRSTCGTAFTRTMRQACRAHCATTGRKASGGGLACEAETARAVTPDLHLFRWPPQRAAAARNARVINQKKGHHNDGQLTWGEKNQAACVRRRT